MRELDDITINNNTTDYKIKNERPSTTQLPPTPSHPSSLSAIKFPQASTMHTNVKIVRADPKDRATLSKICHEALSAETPYILNLRNLDFLSEKQFLNYVHQKTGQSGVVRKAVDGEGNIMGWARWRYNTGKLEGRNLLFRGDFEDSLSKNGAYDRLVENVETGNRGQVEDGNVRHYCLDHIYVAPKYQRKGAGKALLLWGHNAADIKHCICWIRSTPQAHEFFIKMGYQVTGVQEIDFEQGALGSENSNMM